MQLWKKLREHRAELLAAFARRCAAASDRSESDDPPPEIVGLLDQLGVALRRPSGERSSTFLPKANLLAGDLGAAGVEHGRGIRDVVGDLHRLQDAIMEVTTSRGIRVTATEQRVLTRALNRAVSETVARYAEAHGRALERAHAEHFAFLAHELRTPLFNIQLSADAIKHGLRREDLMREIRRATELMRDLIDNEITRARFKSGSSLHAERVELGPFLEGVVDELELQAADREIGIVRAIAHPLELDADPRLLRSVFTNLIANAVKFTRSGRRIRVSTREERAEIVCEIADGCGGLQPGSENTMFKQYVQRGSDRRGFGLGLAIVAEGVERHGGTIEVVNRPGEGCTITVRLPKSHAARQ